MNIRSHMKMQKFEDKHTNNKKFRKVRERCYFAKKDRDVTHSVCNLKYIVPKEIPVVFHNGSNYGYYYQKEASGKLLRII